MLQNWMGTDIQTMLQELTNTIPAGLKGGQDTAKGDLSERQGQFSPHWQRMPHIPGSYNTVDIAQLHSPSI